MKREQIQQQITKDILDNNFEGIIDVSPRVGKTKSVIDALKEYKIREKVNHRSLSVLVTVPTNTIKTDWNIELNKWGSDGLDIEIINQRSLHKLIKKEQHFTVSQYDLVVLDECHSLSNYQREQASHLKTPVLGMTGSLSKKSEQDLMRDLDLKVISKYSIEDAIRDGIISNYEIHVVKVRLDNKIPYVQSGTKKYPKMRTEQGHYNWLTRIIDNYKEGITKVIETRDKVVEGGGAWYGVKDIISGDINMKQVYERKRMNFIYESESKIKSIKLYLSKIKDRTLIFTTRTKVIDSLTPHTYHSNNKSKDNLELFKEGKIDKLGVCNMASMGITFPDLKVGVIHQILSNEENTIQKILRMCNLEDKKKAQIWVTCYKDTVDEEWVENSLKPFPKEKIKYYG